MELISDILLIAGAAGAAFYCFVLSRRLSRFTNLDNGMGGAIAVLSAQVDEMTRALAQAQGAASGSTRTLAALTARAEDVAGRLELLMATMHDLPDAPAATVARPARRAELPETPDPRPQTFRAATTEPGQFRSQRGWIREAAE